MRKHQVNEHNFFFFCDFIYDIFANLINSGKLKNSSTDEWTRFGSIVLTKSCCWTISSLFSCSRVRRLDAWIIRSILASSTMAPSSNVASAVRWSIIYSSPFEFSVCILFFLFAHTFRCVFSHCASLADRVWIELLAAKQKPFLLIAIDEMQKIQTFFLSHFYRLISSTLFGCR